MYYGVIGKEFGDNLSRHESNPFKRMITPQEILMDYQSVRPYVLEMKQTRSDFINMVNQYMLAFLDNQKETEAIFYEKEHVVNSAILENFKTFIFDMDAHMRSFFIRKMTKNHYMSMILKDDMEVFGLLNEELERAFES